MNVRTTQTLTILKGHNPKTTTIRVTWQLAGSVTLKVGDGDEVYLTRQEVNALRDLLDH